MSFVQLLVNGFALGMAYALVALGFVLVLNAVNAVNFAQGDLVMAGGYVGVALAHVLPVPAIIMLPVVLATVAIIGLVLSLLAYFPIMRRPPAAVFISTIAFGVILQTAIAWSSGRKPTPCGRCSPAACGRIGALIISKQAIAVVGTAATLMAIQYYVVERTQFGPGSVRRPRTATWPRPSAFPCGG